MFCIFRSEEALAPLRRAWEPADDSLRAAICRASRQIDLRLHREPAAQGESRGGRRRILFHAPVGVEYEVDANRKVVRVLRSWVYCRDVVA